MKKVVLGILSVLFFHWSMMAQNELVDSAQAMNAKGDYTATIQWVDQALQFQERKLPLKIKADLLSAKGSALRQLGRLSEAVKTHQLALGIRKRIADQYPLDASKSWHNIGNCLLEMHDFKRAELAFETAFVLAQKKRKLTHWATVLQSLGSTYLHQDDLLRANECYSKALHYLEQMHKPRSSTMCDILNNLAIVKLELRDTSEALKLIQRLEQLKNPIALCYAWRLRAIHTQHTGNYDKSEGYLENAISLFEQNKLNNLREELKCLIELSYVYQQKGELDGARKILQLALGKLKVVPEWKSLRGIVHNNLGILMQSGIQDTVAAIQHFEQAIDLFSAFEIEKTYAVYLNLASLFLMKKDFEQGRHYLDLIKPSNAKIEILAKSKLLLGQLNEQMGWADEAQKSYSSAYALLASQKLQYPELFALCIAYWTRYLLKKTTFSEASRLLKEGLLVLGQGVKLNSNLRPAETLDLLSIQAELTLLKARSLPSNTHWFHAWQAHKKAVDFFYQYQRKLIGSVSLLQAGSGYRALFEGIIEVCYNLSRTDSSYQAKAMIYAEMTKSLLLRRLIQESQAKSFARIPSIFIDKEKKLLDAIRLQRALLFEVTDFEKRIDIELAIAKLEEKLRLLNSSLEGQSKEYLRLKYEIPYPNMAQLQKQLNADQSIVSYYLGKQNLYIFVLNQHKLVMKQQRIEADFDSQVKNWFQYISTPKIDTSSLNVMNRLGFGLFEKLILPVQTHLRNKLIIVPDAILHYVPFDALLYKEADSNRPLYKLPCLLKIYTIHYSMSTNFVFRKTQNRTFGHLLAMAPHIDDNPLDLGSLPYTGKEIKAIGKENLTTKCLFIGNKASKNQFLKSAKRAKIIHLATHGIANDLNPHQSFLTFASHPSASFSQNHLTADEIWGLNLRADLVFLSACKTGYGQFYASEGILNLSRSFYYAGAHSLIATLWNIQDSQTVRVSLFFYQNLRLGYSKDLALQRAKLKYLEEASVDETHPAYWAAFMLSGDDSPIFYSLVPWPWIGLVIGIFLFWWIQKRMYEHKRQSL